MFQLQNVDVKDVLEMRDVTLESSVISVEGQSGSGKSTFLRLLNNLDSPKSGNILFKGRDLLDIPPQELRKQVVMVPQNPVIFDGSIRDNLQIGHMFTGETNPTDDQMKEMLYHLWLDKSLHTKASDLSGGEMQRLSLGRVLLLNQAEAYLLDEPSSDLDDRTGRHVMKYFIERAQEQNKQTIMVTHDTSITEQFATMCVNMDQYSKQIRKEDERK